MSDLKLYLLVFVIVFSVCILSACGSSGSSGPFSIFSRNKTSSRTPSEASKTKLPVMQRPANGDPFILQVLSEQFDGNELVLTIGFASFEEADYKAIVIHLMTQNEGQIIDSKEFVVADLFTSYGSFGSTSAKLQQTYQYKFGLSIPATQGSEYQIELLWGDEALPYLEKNSKSLNPEKSGQDKLNQTGDLSKKSEVDKFKGREVPLAEAKGVELQGLRISKKRFCHEKEECQVEFHVAGEIVNLGQDVVTSAVMAVGFLDKESEAYKYGVRIPEQEELVELPNLSLQPKNSQSIKLVLDQRVPQSMENRYQPVLRLVQR